MVGAGEGSPFAFLLPGGQEGDGGPRFPSVFSRTDAYPDAPGDKIRPGSTTAPVPANAAVGLTAGLRLEDPLGDLPEVGPDHVRTIEERV